MGNEQKKAHVGFPEKALEKNAGILVERGLKVVVVEQTETTLKNIKAKTGKAVGREISEILTPSTFGSYYIHANDEPAYVMSIIEIGKIIGLTIGDLSTGEVTLGEVSQEEFRNIVSRGRPAEIVYSNQFITTETLKMLKAQPIVPAFTIIKNSDEWNPIKLNDYFPPGIPSVISGLSAHSSLRSLTGFCWFLRSTLIFDKIISIAQFKVYDQESITQKHMILDSQALEHLEILDASNGKTRSVKGSLYEFLNKCSTPFGKRMLKR